MTRAPTYFARIGEDVRGPFTPVQLRDFAEAGVISRETEVAGSRSGPWLKADALAEREIVFPPAVQFGFRATNYQVLNQGGGAPLPGVDDFLTAAKVDGPVLRPRRDEAAFAVATTTKPTAPLNEVQAMVNEVNAVEARLAPPPAPPRRKRRLSTRLRIVLTLAVLGNAVLAAIPIVYNALGDPWSMLVFKAWFITYNGAMVIVYFSMPGD